MHGTTLQRGKGSREKGWRKKNRQVRPWPHITAERVCNVEKRARSTWHRRTPKKGRDQGRLRQRGLNRLFLWIGQKQTRRRQGESFCAVGKNYGKKRNFGADFVVAESLLGRLQGQGEGDTQSV